MKDNTNDKMKDSTTNYWAMGIIITGLVVAIALEILLWPYLTPIAFAVLNHAVPEFALVVLCLPAALVMVPTMLLALFGFGSPTANNDNDLDDMTGEHELKSAYENIANLMPAAKNRLGTEASHEQQSDNRAVQQFQPSTEPKSALKKNAPLQFSLEREDLEDEAGSEYSDNAPSQPRM